MKALPNADNLVQKKSELKILPKSTKIIKYSATYRRGITGIATTSKHLSKRPLVRLLLVDFQARNANFSGFFLSNRADRMDSNRKS